MDVSIKEPPNHDLIKVSKVIKANKLFKKFRYQYILQPNVPFLPLWEIDRYLGILWIYIEGNNNSTKTSIIIFVDFKTLVTDVPP